MNSQVHTTYECVRVHWRQCSCSREGHTSDSEVVRAHCARVSGIDHRAQGNVAEV